jgi:hypothetical protein
VEPEERFSDLLKKFIEPRAEPLDAAIRYLVTAVRPHD